MIYKAKLSEEEWEEMEPLPSLPSGENISQDKGNIKLLDPVMSKYLNSKWKNLIVRSILGFLMISGFSLIIYIDVARSLRKDDKPKKIKKIRKQNNIQLIQVEQINQTNDNRLETIQEEN